MTDSSKLTRRDWFRLRRPTPQTNVAANAQPPKMGQKTAGLKPIPDPVNHDGMDLSELPPMREAMLTREEVNQLFDDIETQGSDILLMQRVTRTGQATAARAKTSEQLTLAKESLLSASVPRVQIRYRWQDSAWIDTLESKPDGFRLVRINHRGM